MSFFSEYNSVQKLLKGRHQVVVYSESRHYYQYFRSLLDSIIHHSSIQILYVSSDKDDPLFKEHPERLEVVYLKQFLGLFFSRVSSDIMIMTMPDLNNFLYKRSNQVKKYIYVFHAAVSTHLQYREKAFFNYDTIFCVGPFHETELRKAEQLYRLPAKELIPYGYPLFDAIQTKIISSVPKTPGSMLKILIAPSWFESCIFETCIEPLVLELAKFHHQTYLRSHPEYIKRSPQKYKALKKMTSGLSNVYFDENADVINSLVEVDILITDRSGIALEYAFGTCRPVLFIDTPLKISNPNWKSLDIEPLENHIRSAIGMSISPAAIPGISNTLEDLMFQKESYCERIQRLQKQFFFNSPESYRNGLEYILQNTIRN
jgi:YidC/Oxa1 family membrane protein insertase